jgi:hypothetical protein
VDEGKTKAFGDDLQGIEERLAARLIESWLSSDYADFADTMDLLTHLKDLEDKV